jgi:type VI secretion system protein ImpH
VAGETRSAPADVAWLQALAERPYELGFFSALRRLECLHRDRPRLGTSARPADDPVRLCQEPSLLFAPSTLTAFTPQPEGRPPRLSVAFFGLFGPNGALPTHLTEFARDRLHNFQDPTFARFADLFHHRMLSLFYRAWADVRPTVGMDRPDDDAFATEVACLIGLGFASLRGRDAMPDLAKLHHAGHLVCQARYPEGLVAMVRDLFRLSVRLVELVGEWLALRWEDQCRLGENVSTGTLGLTVVIGARVWSRAHKFRLVLGPMGLVQYQGLLPGGGRLEVLVAVVRNYLGDQFAWDVNLGLRREEVPALRLGVVGHLGWTTWLATGGREADAYDLLLQPLRYVG